MRKPPAWVAKPGILPLPVRLLKLPMPLNQPPMAPTAWGRAGSRSSSALAVPVKAVWVGVVVPSTVATCGLPLPICISARWVKSALLACWAARMAELPSAV